MSDATDWRQGWDITKERAGKKAPAVFSLHFQYDHSSHGTKPEYQVNKQCANVNAKMLWESK